ncbi:hypothetical protein DH2020_033085 [Rehmannia glutinosa]|uniref:Pollen Ole e 1 allergen and extensin family protein n=1 Tax=Rehmannia glutinosa TaxID=99300 RepID=A0ABR0VHB4_REHGL
MIRYFQGHMEHLLVKMIFLVFIVSVILETPAIATGEDGSVAEIWSRDELVKWGGYGEEKLSTVVISGKLLCHVGPDDDDKLSRHPYPISGATVAVLCGTRGRKKRSWAKGSTDSYGEFLIDLPSHLHAIPNLEKICLVKVFHLPKSSPCRQAFTGKHKAIKLTSIREARTDGAVVTLSWQALIGLLLSK